MWVLDDDLAVNVGIFYTYFCGEQDCDFGLGQTNAPHTNRPKPHRFLNLPIVTEWQTIDADAVIFFGDLWVAVGGDITLFSAK